MWNSVQQTHVRLVTVKFAYWRVVTSTLRPNGTTNPSSLHGLRCFLHGSLYFYLYIINGSDSYSLIQLSSESFWFWHIPMKRTRPIRHPKPQPFRTTPSHNVQSGLPWHGLDHWLQVESRLSWSQSTTSLHDFLSRKKHGSWKKVIHTN